jgi:hypothetical protein
MSIYCPLAEALGIPTNISILDIPEPDWECVEQANLKSIQSSHVQKKLIEEGRHRFLDRDLQSKNGKIGYEKAIESGKHHSLQPSFRKIASDRIKKGTHNFLDSENQRNNTMKGIQNGTHSSCRIHTCPHCGKVGKGAAMKMWHFDNCRSRK